MQRKYIIKILIFSTAFLYSILNCGEYQDASFFDTASSTQLNTLRKDCLSRCSCPIVLTKKESLEVSRGASTKFLYPSTYPVVPVRSLGVDSGPHDPELLIDIIDGDNILPNVRLWHFSRDNAQSRYDNSFELDNNLEDVGRVFYMPKEVIEKIYLFDQCDKSNFAIGVSDSQSNFCGTIVLFPMNYAKFIEFEFNTVTLAITSLCCHQKQTQFSFSGQSKNQKNYFYVCDVVRRAKGWPFFSKERITMKPKILQFPPGFNAPFTKHILIGPNLFVALVQGQLYFVSFENDNTLKCAHQPVKSFDNAHEFDSFIDIAINNDDDKKTANGKARYLIALNHKRQLFLADLFGYSNTFKLVCELPAIEQLNDGGQFICDFQNAKISFYGNIITVFGVKYGIKKESEEELNKDFPDEDPFFRLYLPADFMHTFDEKVVLSHLAELERKTFIKEAKILEDTKEKINTNDISQKENLESTDEKGENNSSFENSINQNNAPFSKVTVHDAKDNKINVIEKIEFIYSSIFDKTKLFSQVSAALLFLISVLIVFKICSNLKFLKVFYKINN
jgi:hypothetical protein